MFTIQELINGYKQREFSPIEVTKQYLERTKKFHDLNAFITVTEEIAMKQAEIAEEKWMMNMAGKLEGIPISYKDNIYTKGVPSTSGSDIDRDFIPDEDAAVVKTLHHEGAIMIGKNNMHEFAFGITTNNPFYGACKNPWNKKLIPGGSSGGSAAAVAARLSAASIGTDTGASIRLPAAHCGVVGLKPTHRLIDNSKTQLIAWNLDNSGPIAQNVIDTAMVMDALTGGKVSPEHFQLESLKNVRIGVPINHFTEQIEEPVLHDYTQALQNLEALGAILIEVEIPETEAASPTTFVLAVAESGYLHKDRFKHHSEKYGPDVYEVMKSSKEIRAEDYIAALKKQKEISDKLDSVFERVDLIATPTVPALPKPIGVDEVTINGVQEGIFEYMIRYVAHFSLTGHPAISIPSGGTSELPTGLQLVTKKYRENFLLNAAHIYEKYYLHDFYKMRKSKIEAMITS